MFCKECFKPDLFVHFRNDEDWNGKANAEILVKHLLPFAKEAKVVIAHLGGWGGYDLPTNDALGVIINSMHKASSGNKNLYFDLSAVLPTHSNKKAPASASEGSWDPVTVLRNRIHQIGT